MKTGRQMIQRQAQVSPAPQQAPAIQQRTAQPSSGRGQAPQQMAKRGRRPPVDEESAAMEQAFLGKLGRGVQAVRQAPQAIAQSMARRGPAPGTNRPAPFQRALDGYQQMMRRYS